MAGAPAFAQGDCSALESYLAGEGSSVGQFGTALVAVCRAAVDGEQHQWAVARSLKDADPSTLGNDCLAGVMKSLLGRAVEWHERNPGRRPDVALSQVADRTTCARDGDDSDESGADGSDDADSDAGGSDGEGSGAEGSDDDGSGEADDVSGSESEGDVSGGEASEETS